MIRRACVSAVRRVGRERVEVVAALVDVGKVRARSRNARTCGHRAPPEVDEPEVLARDVRALEHECDCRCACPREGHVRDMGQVHVLLCRKGTQARFRNAEGGESPAVNKREWARERGGSWGWAVDEIDTLVSLRLDILASEYRS